MHSGAIISGHGVKVDGRTVAQYRIESELGQGGMGVVYRAWDTRLHRTVALKSLPATVAGDPEALQRLKREARSASSLNHPNICTIYDLVEDAGSWFIVMELLEGQTLQQRLKTAAPITEILEWSAQLADALDYAHGRGIIHRDLKPANIIITDRGLLKVLDFGLAKRTFQAEKVAVSATMSVDDNLTSPGSAVGTVSYMSPEQALGAEVDARTDLFSFGAVLYEIVCGRRAFPGETPAAIFDAILHTDPAPPSKWNPECPPELAHVVTKALEKDRAFRYQSAAEIRADLKRAQRASDSGTHLQLPEAPKHSRGRLPVVLSALALLLVIASASLFYFLHRAEPKPASSGEWIPVTRFSDSAVQPTISPDGRLLAFIRGEHTFMGPGQIYVKTLPDGEPVQLTNDESTKLAPAFSPDSSRITYGTCCTPTWDTWVVPVIGGTPRRLFANATALSWIDSEHLLFSEIKKGVHLGLVTSNMQRGDSRDVYLPAHERAMVHFSALSPDKKSVLVVEMGGDGNFLPCRLVPFDGSSGPRQVGPASRCVAVAWSPDGKWMYFTAEAGDHSHVWREHFPDGPVEQVTSGPNEEAGIAFAPDGSYFITSVGLRDSSIWLHDPSGEHQISSEQQAFAPQFAPDGSKVYYLVHSSDPHGGPMNELWSSDLAGHAQPVLPGVSVAEGGFSIGYAISSDGRRVVYGHATNSPGADSRIRLWVARTDNGAPPAELISDVEETQPFLTDDGTIYFRAAEGGQNYLYRRRMDGSGRERVLPNPIIEIFNISRDGAWAAIAIPQGPDQDVFAKSMLYSLRDDRPPIYLGPDWSPTFSWDSKILYSAQIPQEGAQSIFAINLSALLSHTVGPTSQTDLARLAGKKGVLPNLTDFTPSPHSATYAYTKSTIRRNLYKIPLR